MIVNIPEKNVSINKTFPSGWVVIEKSTGKRLAQFQAKEEANAFTSELPDYLPHTKADSEPVGWKLNPQHQEYTPQCSNGHGSFCLCVNQNIEPEPFCAVRGCHGRAACLGVCRACYGTMKLFGQDFTEQALQRTLECDEDEDGHAAEERAKWAGEQNKRLNHKAIALVSQQYGAVQPKPVPHLGVGVILKQLGNGDWALFDKDGYILSQHSSRDEMIEVFIGGE